MAFLRPKYHFFAHILKKIHNFLLKFTYKASFYLT